ncbi:MAG TPA: hypothetical protein PKI03_29620, partial [Pseudomonadota bacterium]|nr:hypothetical protein [Pseudomonadota bacterium]
MRTAPGYRLLLPVGLLLLGTGCPTRPLPPTTGTAQTEARPSLPGASAAPATAAVPAPAAPPSAAPAPR